MQIEPNLQFSGLIHYQTPLWTLIGVVVGFVLNWLYAAWSRKRDYRERVNQAIGRINGGMYLEGSQFATQRISDLLPQFKEKDQIKILGQVASESSLNEKTDQVTHYVLDNLRWRCALYELFPQQQLVKRSKKDSYNVGANYHAFGKLA